MTAMDMKENILTAINKADHRLLRLINALIKSYHEEEQEEEIVAYTVDGKPLTLAEYRQDIMNAEAAIDRGEYITQEDLEKEVRSWGK